MANSSTVSMKIVGDATGAVKALTDTATAAGSLSQAGDKAKASLGGAFGVISNTGVLGPLGEGLKIASDGFDHMSDHAKSASAVMIGIGGIAAGVGGMLTKEGSGEVQSMNQLKQAVKDTGGTFDEFKDKFEETGKSMEKYAFKTTDTNAALQKLTQATGDPQKALDNMKVTANLAAAAHISLSDASDQVIKIIEGKGTKVLAKYGITQETATKAAGNLSKAQLQLEKDKQGEATAIQTLIDLQDRDHAKKTLSIADHQALEKAQAAADAASKKLSEQEKVVATTQDEVSAATGDTTSQLGLLGQKIDGQAAASVQGFSGHLRVLRTEIEDNVAKMGAKFGPALTGIGAGVSLVSGLAGAGASALKLFTSGTEAATAATEGMTVAEDAAAVSEGLALGPILLVIAGLAALGVAAYEIYQHWDQIWSGIQDIVGAAVGFVNDHLTLILTIALGPLGLAIGELRDHWDSVFSFCKTIISDVWDFVRPIFDAIRSAIGDVRQAIDDVMGPLEKIGGLVKGAGSIAGKVGGFLGFADGTNSAPGGWSWVGEDGPELMNVPRGAQVLPHGQSVALAHSGGGRSVLGGGGPSYYINVSVPVTADKGAIGQSIVESLKAYERRSGTGWRS